MLLIYTLDFLITQTHLVLAFFFLTKFSQMQQTWERESGGKRYKQLSYFLPYFGSSPVPLALPMRFFTIITQDYNCSSTQARDYKCSSSKARDFLCSSTKARDFLTNRLQRISLVEHLIYNQWCSQYKTVQTLVFKNF